MDVLVVTIAWFAVGAAVGVVAARHGHWHGAWMVAAMLGPFALPVSLVWRRRAATARPAVIALGTARREGTIDVLVGLDGSEVSMTAARVALDLLGPVARLITLAAVLDYDTAAPHGDSALYPEPWAEEQRARRHLEIAASSLRTSGHDPGCVVLAGNPADALHAFAASEGYDVVVVGGRGKGLSKLVLGSCASRLAAVSDIPVLIAPAGGTDAARRLDVHSGATRPSEHDGTRGR